MSSPDLLTDSDIQFIEQALGRVPRGIISVSSRSPEGQPTALKMHCVVGEAPFPTHFWLCHPLLIEKINFLESQRLVKPLELLIEETPALAKAFLEDQKRYQAIRNACLTDLDKAYLLKLGILEQYLEKRGIGGIEDFSKIRCLHMQIAHLISDDNVIGQWLQDHFNILDFSEDLNEFRQRIKRDKLIENAL
ncbi:DUF501 domain-containing protein [Litoribrevibacter albus]|uniref:DUF501 domain-containing protein n=1 Tax=Litoribrevibacter albus TaxID=1473156 RepID=A0AA37W838_9GAMM|nr:DUF501 domain-containing protein [Litoribrevibacter albus]GLQ31799.1 hypothetical protein GCM10007876_22780 [Litoribrevibacter albus]